MGMGRGLGLLGLGQRRGGLTACLRIWLIRMRRGILYSGMHKLAYRYEEENQTIPYYRANR